MLSPQADSGMKSALSGVRVLELATVLAGPGTSRHLADFGADVIKVERPGGDATRTMGWKLSENDDSLFWKMINRGKRVVVLDIKVEEDKERFASLAATADVFIENMRPGTLERLGFSPAALLAANPKLVILRVSGFGQTGPYSLRPGFATIAEAMSGYSQLCGDPEGAPLLPPVALTDEVTALVGAFATMLALRHAEHTGEGQVVDVNLLESMLQLMGPLPAAYKHLGYLQPRLGSGIPYTVPRGTYRCRDGSWVALSASAESVAQRVLLILGLDKDERFVNFPRRSEHRIELERLTREWIASRDSMEVLETFQNADAAIARVYSMADVVSDPHIVDRGILEEVDGILMQRPVAQLSRTPGKVSWVGPPSNDFDRNVTWRSDD
jgi:crotonobetainyl-CoA:carnitine CoA-transferase CaiB-like acyl-CoA transferase